MIFRLSYMRKSTQPQMNVEEFDELDEALARVSELEQEGDLYSQLVQAIFDNVEPQFYDKMPFRGRATGKDYTPR